MFHHHVNRKRCADLAPALGLTQQCWARLELQGLETGCHPIDLALAQARIREIDFLHALASLLACPVALSPPRPDLRLQPGEAFRRRGYRSSEGAMAVQVIAPNGALADMLLQRQCDGCLPPIILSTEQALLDALVNRFAVPLLHQAVEALPPQHSARVLDIRPLIAIIGIILLSTLAMLGPLDAPLTRVALVVLLGLTPICAIAALCAMTAAIVSITPSPAPSLLPDSQLPDYTVLVPLYREARVLRQLIGRLASLDYPAPRRQVILLLEADDIQTRRALASVALPYGFLVLVTPPGEPRTKPRALNLGLPFARGTLLTVYDAEDAPEPDQLRLAAATFASSPGQVACLQAKLAISNHADCWMTRRFAQDYAALFDCIKAGFARAGWPVALGGTSNHFRTETLRAIGGWDAANVTEDADLGYRFALAGMTVGELRSTTWEEAPNQIGNWRNQRVRWIKGWYQTLIVHARHLPDYANRLDPLAFLAGVCVPIAMLVAALFMPLFAGLAVARVTAPLSFFGNSPWQAIADANFLFLLVLGALAELTAMVIAHLHRGWLRRLHWLALLPLTYLMVSYCAWVALVELWRRPQHWRKTAHGLSRAAAEWKPPAQKQSATSPFTASKNTELPCRDHRTTPAASNSDTTTA